MKGEIKRGEEKMEIPVKVVETINAGEHTAIIISVDERDVENKGKVISYIDYKMEVSGKKGVNVKVGFPTHITKGLDGVPKSTHAVFLKNLGIALEGSVNPMNVIGKTVKFFVKMQETPKGTFARVVKDTITPVEV